jgi:hypothetical protein
MGRSWRWRICPRCRRTERASDYRYVGSYSHGGWGEGYGDRRCPNCGFEAATWRFQVVRERHAEPARGGV